jgi:hypothetical protein
MFSAVGGFRFISASGLKYGIYLIDGVNDIVQGYQTLGGNTYWVGSPGTANNDIVVARYGPDNTAIFSQSLSGSSTADIPNNMVLDSSYNQYTVGTTTANTVGQRDLYISKFDSSGSLQWQRTIGTSTQENVYDVALVDSSANLIVTGKSAGSDGFIGKMSSSTGALLTQNQASSSSQVVAVTTDSSGNVYLLINEQSSGSRESTVVIKMNSSFTITWQKRIGYTTGTVDVNGQALGVDSSGNVYITCSDTPTNNNFIVKLNSSGTLQWQNELNFSVNSTSIAIDSSDNVYLGCEFGPPVTAQVIKFDTNGTIVWARGLNGYNLTPATPSTAEDVGSNNINWYNGRILINGYSYFSGVRKGMLMTVPDDGTLLGTYSYGYVWGFSPITVSAGGLTVSAGATSFSTAGLTDAAGTLTSSSYGTAVGQNIVF